MKERILKKINPDFIAIFIFAILIGSINFYIKFEINDELWNFSNVYKMCNGYQIYKDLNVIITPLFFYLGELFLKVFGTNYFSFKIYNFFPVVRPCAFMRPMACLASGFTVSAMSIWPMTAR